MVKYPRVLVISNNCFSLTNSNGRTLGNFFINWPKECLAEFCIRPRDPNFDICNNYFCMTDKSVFDSILTFSSPKRTVLKPSDNTANKVRKKRKIKNVISQYLRNLMWSISHWKTSEFESWIFEFNPDVLLIVNTDAYFMFDIACKLQKSLMIPLVMYSSEGFYFFEKNYFSKTPFDNLIFNFFQCKYRSAYKKLMAHTSYVIYGNSLLKKDFDKEFHIPSTCIYTSSKVEFRPKKTINNPPKFSYIGNYGFNRDLALIEIGKVLLQINPSYKLDLYGNPSDKIVKRLESSIGVVFHGFIPYYETINTIYNSDIVFHAEGQEIELQESLRYGFSTKIADSISSGHPFLMYSSPNIAGAKYVIETGAGWHASNQKELKEKILSILTDDDKRKKVLEAAKELAKSNHNAVKNADTFRKILCSVVTAVN